MAHNHLAQPIEEKLKHNFFQNELDSINAEFYKRIKSKKRLSFHPSFIGIQIFEF